MKGRLPKQLPTDLVPLMEARKLLGVSRVKLTELVREGYLKLYSSPLDRRFKLVSRAELVKLKRSAPAT